MCKNKNPVGRLEEPVAGHADQPGHALGRINRVEQNAFKTRKQADCLEGAIGRDAIAFADITVVHEDLAQRNTLDPQFFQCLLGQGVDGVHLFLARLPDADTHHRQRVPKRVKPGDQPCLGSGAAGAHDQPVKGPARLLRVIRDLLGAVDIAQSSDRVRSTTRDEVGAMPVAGQFVGHGLRLGVHVEASRAEFVCCPEKLIEKDVSGFFVTGIPVRDPAFEQDVTLHPHLACRRGGLAHMVRLNGALSDQHVGLLASWRRRQETPASVSCFRPSPDRCSHRA